MMARHCTNLSTNVDAKITMALLCWPIACNIRIATNLGITYIVLSNSYTLQNLLLSLIIPAKRKEDMLFLAVKPS
jgi:hypothetical protein